MDYNDVAERLKKTLHSMNARFDDDIAVVTTIEKGPDSVFVKYDFSSQDKEGIINKIFIILYNLSSLKDHLKNCLKNKNQDPKLVESEINSSLHLQVLIDIVNQEKHGYPLKQSNRSGKNPLLREVNKVLRQSSVEIAKDRHYALMTFSFDGKINVEVGNAKTVITANVTDDKGAVLFELDELVDTCYQKFELLAKQYSCF